MLQVEGFRGEGGAQMWPLFLGDISLIWPTWGQGSEGLTASSLSQLSLPGASLGGASHSCRLTVSGHWGLSRSLLTHASPYM